MGGKRRRDAASVAAAAVAAEARLHCDEADSHFKTGNFNKALRSYNKVRVLTELYPLEVLFPSSLLRHGVLPEYRPEGACTPAPDSSCFMFEIGNPVD